MTLDNGCTLNPGVVIRTNEPVLISNPARTGFANHPGVIRKINPQPMYHVGYIEVQVGEAVGWFCPCELSAAEPVCEAPK